MGLRGRWCNIIARIAYTPTEEKRDDSKGSFYEELDHVFRHFPKHHIKIVKGDFSEKLERIFWNRQLGMRDYMRIAMLITLE